MRPVDPSARQPYLVQRSLTGARRAVCDTTTRSTQPRPCICRDERGGTVCEIARGGWAPAAGRRMHRSRWWRQRSCADGIAGHRNQARAAESMTTRSAAPRDAAGGSVCKAAVSCAAVVDRSAKSGDDARRAPEAGAPAAGRRMHRSWERQRSPESRVQSPESSESSGSQAPESGQPDRSSSRPAKADYGTLRERDFRLLTRQTL